MLAHLRGVLALSAFLVHGLAVAQFADVTVTSGDVQGLRDGIQQINQAGNGRIEIVANATGEFPPFEFTSDFEGTGNALPILTGNVSTFSATDEVMFIGNDQFRFLEIAGNGGIAINRGTYSNFRAQGDGGLVLARDTGRVIFFACKITNNEATGNGGAIATRDLARLEITSCDLQRNQAQLGGAITLASDTDRYHQIYGNRFSNNQASVFGCDLDIRTSQQTDTRVSNNTFDGSCMNVLIENPSGNMSFRSNTFAGMGASIDSTATAEFFGNIFGAIEANRKSAQTKINCRDFGSGAFESLGNNIANDNSCDLDQPTDQPDTDPMLGPLGPKGTYTLLANSPAIDAGKQEILLIDGAPRLPCGYADGEGLGRPQDANGDGVYECDIGSYEVQGGPNLGAGQTGAFFDSTRNGEGAFVEMLNSGQALVAEFSYQPGGNGASWFLGLGNTVGNSIVIDEMLLPVGGVFGAAFDAAAIDRQLIGGFSMVFSNCQAAGTPGRMSFQANADTDFEDILVRAQRLTTVVPCTGAAPAVAGRSGSFFDVTRSGEGIFVQWLSETSVLIIWYTFTPQGEQMWIISDGATANGNIVTAPMLYPTGFTSFGQGFNANEVVLTPWGTITLEYQPGCNSMVFSYDAAAPGYGSGSFNYSRLTNLAGASCDL